MVRSSFYYMGGDVRWHQRALLKQTWILWGHHRVLLNILLRGLRIWEGFERKASVGAEIGKTVSWWWVSLFLVALYRGLRERDGLFQQVTAWVRPRGHGDLGMRSDHRDVIALRGQRKLVSSVLMEREAAQRPGDVLPLTLWQLDHVQCLRTRKAWCCS